jgi:hypothetical protein
VITSPLPTLVDTGGVVSVTEIVALPLLKNASMLMLGGVGGFGLAAMTQSLGFWQGDDGGHPVKADTRKAANANSRDV